MKEAELRKAGRDLGRSMGLLVKDISMAGPVPQQLVGLPDQLVWGPNRFLTVEYKVEGRELRGAQMDFIEDVTPYIGENVMHVVAFCIEQVKIWFEWCAGGGWPGEVEDSLASEVEEEPF